MYHRNINWTKSRSYDPASNAPTVVILLLPAFNENVAFALSVVIREFNWVWISEVTPSLCSNSAEVVFKPVNLLISDANADTVVPPY